jgi:hypothetical protein
MNNRINGHEIWPEVESANFSQAGFSSAKFNKIDLIRYFRAFYKPVWNLSGNQKKEDVLARKKEFFVFRGLFFIDNSRHCPVRSRAFSGSG